MDQAESYPENREPTERRLFSWRTVLFGFLRARRREPRRDTEEEPVYTDWHHPWLFFLSIGIMLLSSVDAFLTLRLLELGAVEINPVMASVMGTSTAAFAMSKMLLTGAGILVLVFMSRARFMNRVRTGLILTAFFALYACLVCYEFVILLERI